ncbi:MAG: glycogen debranching protein [Nitrospiraceae bacterium]|nr:glycogen debranching protein [Nitrospiraceae bacterium]
MSELVETARSKAVEVLDRCLHDGGVNASAPLGDFLGYHGVWARDSMITCLGMSLLGEERFVAALKNSLTTLRDNQTETGHIPVNVMAETGKPGKQGLPGPIDSNAWYVIGHWYLYAITGDTAFLKESWLSIDKAIFWLRCQDNSDTGVIYSPESSDWMDIFAYRGNVFYDNILYWASLFVAGPLGEACGEDGFQYPALADFVRDRIDLRFWLERRIMGSARPEDAVTAREGRILDVCDQWLREYQMHRSHLEGRPYYLAWLDMHDCAHHFDTFGNVLAVLFGFAKHFGHEESILDYIRDHGVAEPYPIKSIHPPIYPGDPTWRDYHFRNNFNIPYCYHNAAIWPFMGGLYVAALVRAGRMEEAGKALVKLAEMAQLGRYEGWEFNEWFHGDRGAPLGFPRQAWSASSYILAYECVKAGEVPYIQSTFPA